MSTPRQINHVLNLNSRLTRRLRRSFNLKSLKAVSTVDSSRRAVVIHLKPSSPFFRNLPLAVQNSYDTSVYTLPTKKASPTSKNLLLITPSRSSQGRFLSNRSNHKINFFRKQRDLVLSSSLPVLRRASAPALRYGKAGAFWSLPKALGAQGLRRASRQIVQLAAARQARRQAKLLRAAMNRNKLWRPNLSGRRPADLFKFLPALEEVTPSVAELETEDVVSVYWALEHARSYLYTKYCRFPICMSPDILTEHRLRPRLIAPLKFSLSVFTWSVRAKWLRSWARLAEFYSLAATSPHTELYLVVKKAEKLSARHFISMRFKQSKLLINLLDEKSKTTHFFLSTGLFVKYFQGKKSLRKNKSMKLLMARFMRKILIVLGLKHVTVFCRGVPVFLDTFLSMLFKTLAHPFTDPSTGLVIDEVGERATNINIKAVQFDRPKPFGTQKMKKRGRLKRKIRRKLIRLNRVID